METPNYEFRITNNVVIATFLSGNPSVDSAQAVITDLADIFNGHLPHPVIYRASGGLYCSILHNGSERTGGWLLMARDEKSAIKLVRRIDREVLA